MGKKKKKVKVIYRDVYRDDPKPKRSKPIQVDVETAPALEEPAIEITPERQKQAVDRLTAMLKALSAEPEPVRDLLYRLEIPWEVRYLTPKIDIEQSNGDNPYTEEIEDEKYIVIKFTDLEAGEVRNKEQGSIAKRIWGDLAEESLAEKAKAQAAQPITGEVIQPARMPSASDFADLMKKLQDAQEKVAQQQQNGVN